MNTEKHFTNSCENGSKGICGIMNCKKCSKKMITIGVAIILIGGLMWAYQTITTQATEPNIPQRNEALIQKTSDALIVKKDEINIQNSAPEYVSYSEDLVNKALNENKKVILFFNASRCPSCQGLDKELIEKIKELPVNSIVFKVDYDNSNELKQKYGITSQHTTVRIDGQKNLINKSQGASVNDIITQLQ